MEMNGTHRWVLFGGVSLLIVLVFYPVLGSYFVTDDMRLIYISSPLSTNSILEYFTSSGGFFSGFYRPLVRLAFFMDYSLYHLNPTGFHVTNLLFHIANTILVFFLAKKLTGSEISGGFAALIFSVQPLHTEAVSWISGRSDLILTSFYLLAFLSFLKFITGAGAKNLYLALSSFFFILSLMSKETAISLPAILFLTEYFFYRGESERTRRWIEFRKYMPFIFICVFYVIIKTLFIKGRLYSSEIGIMTLWRTGYAFLQLFAPINIDTFHYRNMSGFILNSFIVLNLVVLLLAYLYFCRDRKRLVHFLTYCALWIGITSFPLYFDSGARFLYIASVASSMMMGFVLKETWYGAKKQNPVLSKVLISFLVVSIVLTSSIRILHRNKLYNYAGHIADGILSQLNNKYPTFPKGSVLYFINFPNDWIRDTEGWVKPIPVMSMAIKVKYNDDSLIVNSKPQRVLTFEEKLQFLKKNSIRKYTIEGKPWYIFEYQDSNVIETTKLFRDKLE